MAGNPFKLEFTLKQHTPLIHFQHDKEGATLRATELKPKLDRFIIEHVFHNQFEKANKYLVGYPFDDTSEKGHRKVEELRGKFEGKDKFRALDYKVKIEIINKTNVKSSERYLFGSLIKTHQKLAINKLHITPVDKSPYFADNEKIKNGDYLAAKIGVFYNEDNFSIKMTIFSTHSELLENVNLHIDSFFILHNFGSRQSKGFGSFTTTNIRSSKECEKILLRYNKCVYGTSQKSTFEEMFKIINTENQELKSGTANIGSGLADYYLYENENLVWDKLAVENHFIENEDKTSDWLFVRALLGLSSSNTYEKGKLSYLSRIDIKEISEEIERIPSPLLFKVIYGKIYITISEIDERIYGKTFKFTPKLGGQESMLLSTPNIESKLNLTDFLDTYLSDKWRKI